MASSLGCAPSPVPLSQVAEIARAALGMEIAMGSPPCRQRLALCRFRDIGGGVSGLTAAHELSRTEAARAAWRVEVIEMGDRLGGRLASAHRDDEWGQNLEHDLPYWVVNIQVCGGWGPAWEGVRTLMVQGSECLNRSARKVFGDIFSLTSRRKRGDWAWEMSVSADL